MTGNENLENLATLEKKLLDMKDTSELMMDLAYSALLYNNKKIAQEVYHLENLIDRMYEDIQNLAVRDTAKTNPSVALTLIRLATSIEMIGDSARGIADVVLRDIEPHPIVEMSIRESEVIISKTQVTPKSRMLDCTLGKLRLASETGMWVVAIRRGDDWLFGPDEFTKIKAGDVLIARGPLESEKIFLRWARGKTGFKR
jgi:uncharacterized protein with PhoU and TrkA domain